MPAKPWIPNESAQLRARESWETRHKTHKRPPDLDISAQARVSYSIRFALAGDLASARQTFGGISAQFTRLGAVLNIATIENATIATTYDTKIRTYAGELSEFRGRESEIIALLTNEDRRIKRGTPRGCGFARSFTRVPNRDRRRTYDKEDQKQTKRDKGKRKGKGKGKRAMPERISHGNSRNMTGRTRGTSASVITGPSLRMTGRKEHLISPNKRTINPRPTTPNHRRRRNEGAWREPNFLYIRQGTITSVGR